MAGIRRYFAISVRRAAVPAPAGVDAAGRAHALAGRRRQRRHLLAAPRRLLRPLPFPDAHRLVAVVDNFRADGQSNVPPTVPELLDLRAASQQLTRDFVLRHPRRADQRRHRARPRGRRARRLGVSRHARGAAGAWAAVRRRRSHAGRDQRGHSLRQVLAQEPRCRSRRRGPSHRRQRRAVRNRRRAAGWLHVRLPLDRADRAVRAVSRGRRVPLARRANSPTSVG